MIQRVDFQQKVVCRLKNLDLLSKASWRMGWELWLRRAKTRSWRGGGIQVRCQCTYSLGLGTGMQSSYWVDREKEITGHSYMNMLVMDHQISTFQVKKNKSLQFTQPRHFTCWHANDSSSPHPNSSCSTSLASRFISCCSCWFHNQEMNIMQLKSPSNAEYSSRPLTWTRRIDIGLGASRGLLHLHENRHNSQRYQAKQHSSNPWLWTTGKAQQKCASWLSGLLFYGLSLLDPELSHWQIGEFGIMRVKRDTNKFAKYRIRCSSDYQAPEYAVNGMVSNKPDVYSFGVVLLELITARVVTEMAPRETSLPPQN